MKKFVISLISGCCLFMLTGKSFAHFGMIIPSDNMVMQGDRRKISVQISFSHPMEMIGMDMDRPKHCAVVVHGKSSDLLGGLKETKVMDRKAWILNYKINRPGVYTFYVEPQPYWEPAEDCYIIHYTKTVVAAFGEEEGWDEPVGLETEIIPLTRPFGLYAGNVFQGRVLVNGKPVPNAEVEVEYYNANQRAQAPTDYMVTQVIKADGNGIFTYAVPKAGWWGFAGLSTSDKKMNFRGEEKDVEIGAVIWVQFHEWQGK